jgi:hypothetical protein
MDVLERVRTTLGTFPDNDIRHLLHADHRRIRELAQELAETGSAPRRKALLHELKPLLVAHARAEEASAYTRLLALRRSEEARRAANEGLVEHNLADILLERLVTAKDTSSALYKAHAEVLRESLEHHIKEEERLVFEALGVHFSAEARAAMAAQFTQEKTRHLERMAGAARRARQRAATATA